MKIEQLNLDLTDVDESTVTLTMSFEEVQIFKALVQNPHPNYEGEDFKNVCGEFFHVLKNMIDMIYRLKSQSESDEIIL